MDVDARIAETVPAPSPPFRDNTRISKTPFALVYNCGGIGDYIHWTPAIRYAIDTNPHIHGVISSPRYFGELARHWLGGYSERFTVHEHDDIAADPILKNYPAIAPERNQFANATGFHLFQLGFIYYNQINFIPTGYEKIPELTGNEVPVDQFNLPARFAVINTLATHENRRLPSETINRIFNFLIASGITPVILGKHEMISDYTAKENDGIDYSRTLDIRNQTGLLEAAAIMSRALFVFGLDNGLLHLAACTGVPIIYLFTTVHPRLRLPPRREGTKTYTVTPGEELKCRFCTDMKFISGHDFKDCLYKTNDCVKFHPDDLIAIIKEALK